MPDVAFAPKVGVELDALGAVFIDDGHDVNVREAVTSSEHAPRLRPSPKGYLVSDDPSVIRALDGYDQLKRVSLSEVEEAAKPKTKSKATKDED